MTNIIEIGNLESLIIALFVLILGKFIKQIIPILKKYNIPEPIVGGLFVAIITMILRNNGMIIRFTLDLKDPFMLMFFTTVGLGASYKLLAQGGKKLFIFLGVASLYIIIQNIVGVSLASLLGLDPLLGLVAGSITLSGGHGTGAAWAQIFLDEYGLHTMEFAMASATFGLVVGGIIGGPLAQNLIKKHKLKSSYGNNHNLHKTHPELITYDEEEEDNITAKRMLESLFLIMICVGGAKLINHLVVENNLNWLKMPQFVYALFLGVIIANIIEFIPNKKVNNECIDIIGTVSLYLFLAMALMNLKLWEIFDLALPLLIILIVQTLTLALFAYFITFRIMGKNYDAAIITGGHCGFGMGATPTAVMNMGTLVAQSGPSPQAYMIVPIVGAFFIDLVNLIILQGFIHFIK